MNFNYRYVAIAVMAVAGHQNLLAGYRVIDGSQEVQQATTAPVAPAVVASVVAPAQDQSLVNRITELEAENAQLRERLREAEFQAGKRRALSGESDQATALSFELGSAKLSPSVARKAELVKRAKRASAIEIIGYTDNTGSEGVNKRIALARAELVKNILVRNGVLPEIIKVREQAGIYYATNETVEGRAANRRAIVTFK